MWIDPAAAWWLLDEAETSVNGRNVLFYLVKKLYWVYFYVLSITSLCPFPIVKNIDLATESSWCAGYISKETLNLLFQVCGQGAEDGQTRHIRTFQRGHAVLQRHRGLHDHLGSQWTHRGGRPPQWPLHTLWCHHWATRCLQSECCFLCTLNAKCAASVVLLAQ